MTPILMKCFFLDSTGAASTKYYTTGNQVTIGSITYQPGFAQQVEDITTAASMQFDYVPSSATIIFNDTENQISSIFTAYNQIGQYITFYTLNSDSTATIDLAHIRIDRYMPIGATSFRVECRDVASMNSDVMYTVQTGDTEGLIDPLGTYHTWLSGTPDESEYGGTTDLEGLVVGKRLELTKYGVSKNPTGPNTQSVRRVWKTDETEMDPAILFSGETEYSFTYPNGEAGTFTVIDDSLGSETEYYFNPLDGISTDSDRPTMIDQFKAICITSSRIFDEFSAKATDWQTLMQDRDLNSSIENSRLSGLYQGSKDGAGLMKDFCTSCSSVPIRTDDGETYPAAIDYNTGYTTASVFSNIDANQVVQFQDEGISLSDTVNKFVCNFAFSPRENTFKRKRDFNSGTKLALQARFGEIQQKDGQDFRWCYDYYAAFQSQKYWTLENGLPTHKIMIAMQDDYFSSALRPGLVVSLAHPDDITKAAITRYYMILEIRRNPDGGLVNLVCRDITALNAINRNFKLSVHGGDVGDTYDYAGDTMLRVYDHSITGNNRIEANTMKYVYDSDFPGDGVTLQKDGTNKFCKITWTNQSWGDILNNTDWTLFMWVKFSDLTGSQALAVNHVETEDTYWRLLFDTTDDSLRFRVRSVGSNKIATSTGASTITSTSDVYFISVHKVGSKFGVYIDGVQKVYVSYAGTESVLGTLFTHCYYDQPTDTWSSSFTGKMLGPFVFLENIFNVTPAAMPGGSSFTVPTVIPHAWGFIMPTTTI